jgi:hypothetical protein
MKKTLLPNEQIAHPVSPIATETEKSKGLRRTEKGGSGVFARYVTKESIPTVGDFLLQLRNKQEQAG